MRKTIASFFLATGLVIGGYVVYRVPSGAVGIKEALPEGCELQAAEGEFSSNLEGRRWLADAGVVAQQYVRLQFPVGVCEATKELILPNLPYKQLTLLRDDALSRTPCRDRAGICELWGRDRPFKTVPHQCAWKPNPAAVCTLADGGNPGVENTMLPGRYAGAGCVVKSCTELAGESSRPQ